MMHCNKVGWKQEAVGGRCELFFVTKWL